MCKRVNCVCVCDRVCACARVCDGYIMTGCAGAGAGAGACACAGAGAGVCA